MKLILIYEGNKKNLCNKMLFTNKYNMLLTEVNTTYPFYGKNTKRTTDCCLSTPGTFT